MLVASMTVMVLSFLTGQKACRVQLALLDKEYQDEERPAQTNLWSTVTVWLNGSSFFLFLGGVVLILIFSWLNLPNAQLATPSMSEAKGENSTMLEGSRQPQPPSLLPPSQPKPGTGHPPPTPPVPVRPAPPPDKK